MRIAMLKTTLASLMPASIPGFFLYVSAHLDDISKIVGIVVLILQGTYTTCKILKLEKKDEHTETD